MDLSTTAGIDVTFDGNTGNLGVDIAFAPEDIAAVVVFNDLATEANSSLESNFNTLAETLIGPLLGDALAGLEFALPAIEGLGLVDAAVDGVGPIEDFGVFGTIGAVPYGGGAGGGCDSGAGCDAGCSGGGQGSGALPSWG